MNSHFTDTFTRKIGKISYLCIGIFIITTLRTIKSERQCYKTLCIQFYELVACKNKCTILWINNHVPLNDEQFITLLLKAHLHFLLMHAFFSFGVTCVFLKWLSWFGQPMQSMHRNALQYQKCMRKEYVATTRFDYNFITLSLRVFSSQKKILPF